MVTNEAVRDAGRSPDELTIAIQGFGNVGSWTARLATAEGYRVVAVSDIQGGIYSPHGLSIPEVVEHVRQNGTVVGYPGAEPFSNFELLTLDVDVLIPAALSHAITKVNADEVRARMVVEAANAPITPAADRILLDKGVTVVPDILANAGGVTVSYFEWTQNVQQFRWDEDRVNAELGKYMVKAYQQVRDYARTHESDLRHAAYAIAVKRVATAAHLRGYI
jgi:glutamate dehydrogenase (NAD(P)+)